MLGNKAESNRSIPMKASPSMAAIAKEAGVAKSTVSLALRNDLRVAKEQRQRIQQVAARMGYQSNALVARLMFELRKTRKQKYIAKLATINTTGLPNLHRKISHIKSLLDGVGRRAEQLGYSVDDFWLQDPDLRPDRLAKIFQARNVQGVIFYGIQDESCLRGSQTIWSNFPCITVGSHQRNPAINFVMNDMHFTSMHACSQLRKSGYSRIGIILDRWLDEVMERRMTAGYTASFEEGDNRPPILHLHDPQENQRADGKQRFAAWLTRYRPDACLCINRFILDWAKELGMDIPRDMGIALLDLPSDLEGIAAGMTSRPELLGMTAVDTLVGQIHRGEQGIPTLQCGTLIESQWIPGPTVREVHAPSVGVA